MHIEPLIKILKKSWFYRILLYISTNTGLALIIEIWKYKWWKIIIIVFFMIIYMIAYENLGIMFDRLKGK